MNVLDRDPEDFTVEDKLSEVTAALVKVYLPGLYSAVSAKINDYEDRYEMYKLDEQVASMSATAMHIHKKVTKPAVPKVRLSPMWADRFADILKRFKVIAPDGPKTLAPSQIFGNLIVDGYADNSSNAAADELFSLFGLIEETKVLLQETYDKLK